MKLDLLYEIDVHKPWGEPHPHGQHEAEQRASTEALEWESPNSPQEERDAIFPLRKRQLEGDFDPHESSEADMIVVGDPDQCLRKMRHDDELGVDQLICDVQFGHLSHESILRTIELLGTELIPQLERGGVEVDARVSAS